MIGRVDVNAHTRQGGLESLLGSAVKHFGTNVGRVRVPGNEDELAGGSSIVRLKVQIDQSVTTIVIRKLGAKVLVGLGTSALVFNDNGLLVLDLVDVVAKLLALLELEGVEGRGDFVVDNDTGGLEEG